MYAKYIMEREGAETIESHKGFISYKFDDKFCIITDIFIDPMFRNNDVGRLFGQEVEQKAKEKEINVIYCFADKNALNYEDSVNFILKNGYKLESQNKDRVMFKKEL